jgi:hypothetical protein
MGRIIPDYCKNEKTSVGLNSLENFALESYEYNRQRIIGI